MDFIKFDLISELFSGWGCHIFVRECMDFGQAIEKCSM